MKQNKIEYNRQKTIYFICLSILLIASVLLPILLKTNTAVQYKSIYSGFVKGQISERTVYAKSSIDLVDQEATEKLRKNAIASVYPIFSYSQLKSSEIIMKIDSLRNALSSNDQKTIASILGQNIKVNDLRILGLCYDIISEIIQKGYFDSTELNKIQDNNREEILLSNYYDDNSYEEVLNLNDDSILTTANIGLYLTSRILSIDNNLSASDAMLMQDIILEIVEPNIRYDQFLTEQRQKEAENSVSTVIIPIEKGQVLIEVDHVVTQEQVDLLKLLSTQSKSFSLFEVIGYIIFDAIVLSVGLYVFNYFIGKNNLHYLQYHVLLVIGYLISIVATYFLSLVSSNLNLEFSDSFLPVFLLPLLMTDVTGHKNLGFVTSAMFSAVMVTLPSASIMTFFYCLISGSACVLLIRFFNRRIDIVYQWFFSCITCSAITILFLLINDSTLTAIFVVLIGALINISIALILISILLPLAEKVFNIPTIFRLYELAYGESPLLTRLSQVAPGTYSHSLAVADLAESGAKAINANPLLARVGGLYHDIGKVEHPEYFIENQSGVNKHDDISPSLSVAVIKSHIKVGADKAKEARLPQEVIKMISSHHGNDIIQYFYHEALKAQAANSDNKGEVIKASDYSYNADIPDFKECGIVMLADSIEAASRTVTPNATKYSKLIDSIFLGKIERGQLDDSNLTLNDIKALSDAFVKVLVARNHSRIEYPDNEED